MPEIKWLGHACFRVRGRDAVILMDPAGPETGYSVQRQKADIVTLSHDHAGHTALERVEPGYQAITGPGEYEISDVLIHGVRTDHDAESGRRLGKNTVYLVEIDDLVIGHLGDLGHTLSKDQVSEMSVVDILLIPVGGPPTINAAQAAEVIGQLEPSIVIPMQYRTEHGDHDRAPIEPFLKEMGITGLEPVDRFSVKPADLGEAVQVVLLKP